MNIETLTLGALATNCYLVYDPDLREALVIDPADEAVFIAENLQRLNLRLTAIVATHGHFDHVLGAGELQLIYPDAPFYIHEKDVFLLKNMNSSASHWLKTKEKRPLPQTIRYLDEKNFRLELVPSIPEGTLDFRLIHTPGHTPGSVCLYFSTSVYQKELSKGNNKKTDALIFRLTDQPIIFTGDTLFKDAVGRTDFSYSDATALERSLKKLFTLPKDTRVYPGHGEMTTIGDETYV